MSNMKLNVQLQLTPEEIKQLQQGQAINRSVPVSVTPMSKQELDQEYDRWFRPMFELMDRSPFDMDDFFSRGMSWARRWHDEAFKALHHDTAKSLTDKSEKTAGTAANHASHQQKESKAA